MLPADWFVTRNPGWWLLWAMERERSAHPGATVRVRLEDVTVCGFVPDGPSGEVRVLEGDPARCAAQYRPTETRRYAC
ncbi:MAG: hypothetical protein MUF57_01175 [Gammaproteobacteria bacterium]|jgi:hypothetical protein|nr:hypothetical protein [Gammaproteobacteria bacterium]